MLLSLSMLLGGLALIVKGGEWFVAAAVKTAEFLRMPRVVIGSTLVSLATTTPELVVSIMAGLHGHSGLAVGNAVGSCICNIGLIVGVTAALKHVDVHLRALRTALMVMFGAAVALFLMTMGLRLGRWEGAVLLAAGVGYFIWDFVTHFRDRKPRDLDEAKAIEREHTRQGVRWLETRTGTAMQFIGGAAVVVVGSRLLVGGAVEVAAALGVPSIIIGLTVVAVGTSLPELVTAVSSSRQAVSDLSIGNVIGANIANLTLIVGAAALLHELEMNRATQLFSFPAMLVGMGLLLWVLSTDRRVSRREGAVLLGYYGLYLMGVILLALLAH